MFQSCSNWTMGTCCCFCLQKPSNTESYANLPIDDSEEYFSQAIVIEEIEHTQFNPQYYQHTGNQHAPHYGFSHGAYPPQFGISGEYSHTGFGYYWMANFYLYKNKWHSFQSSCSCSQACIIAHTSQ